MWTRFRARLALFGWVLLTPELVMFLACRQWLGARYIKKKMIELERKTPKAPSSDEVGQEQDSQEKQEKGGVQLVSAQSEAESTGERTQGEARDGVHSPQVQKEAQSGEEKSKQEKERKTREQAMKDNRKWDMTAAHYLQMGGILFRNKNSDRFLDPIKLIHNPSWPYSEALNALFDPNRHYLGTKEIADRSKGDAVSKALVIVQTTWFACQFVARMIEGLDVTELEAVTLAYAVLNAVMFFFWWDKPLDTQRPIVIDLPGEPTEGATDPFIEEDKGNEQQKGGVLQTIWKLLTWAPKSIIQSVGNMMESISINKSIDSFSSAPLYYAAIPLPKKHRDEKDEIGPYCGLAIVMCFLAAAFGAIHCISWSSSFPMPLLQTMWRVSCLYITISPLLFAVGPAVQWFTVVHERHFEGLEWLIKKVEDYATSNVWVDLMIGTPYSVARCLLAVIAIWGLWHISATGHQEVSWANFVPHI
ncbi:hypothetical protein EST38_g4053 [Candolleomyces aberdarensis]|uniref:Uncharacterized protein n=1 Tax=Candolleomyces aberdarensis TaxID=2316362 RepID=A0A4Q2DNS7_9AGAR|nr:hypothetical protein EST38_g4053 [Candolleomyces aberdarensis]